MIEEPTVVVRLNGLLAATRIAHEAIYDLQAELVPQGGAASDRAGELLTESAGVTLTEIPELTAEARRLAKTWREQSVLDPDAAELTLQDLTAELERVEPDIRRRLDRQREIAHQLQSLQDKPA